MPSVEELEAQLKAAYAAAREESSGNLAPGAPAQPENRYAPTVWGQTEYDFTCPSGQTCRMRKLKPEDLIAAGILDQMTRLPGFAQELVDKAEGAPPVKTDEMPDAETINSLVIVLDVLIPMVVVQPPVLPEPKADESGEVAGHIPGQVYTSDIELADRVAIMERAVGGVKRFDNFREES